MDIISIVTGILSWLQVSMGQASVTAGTIYQGAVLVDKATTEDLKGTWSAELQEQGIQIIKGLVVRVDKSDLY
jgi:hypothetical protein